MDREAMKARLQEICEQHDVKEADYEAGRISQGQYAGWVNRHYFEATDLVAGLERISA